MLSECAACCVHNAAMIDSLQIFKMSRKRSAGQDKFVFSQKWHQYKLLKPTTMFSRPTKQHKNGLYR